MISNNSFNFLRLLLAVLVILSHSYEISCSGRSCEPLTMLFGTMSFGEFAVSGFFIVSGYLITASWVNNPSVPAYLNKRIRRIFPAFIICNLVSLLILAPLAKGGFDFLANIDWAGFVLGVVTLSQPKIDNIYPNTIYNSLNISLWSIQYEFACYLGLMVLMLLFGKRSHALAWITFCCLLVVYLAGSWLVNSGGPPGSSYLTKSFIRMPIFFLSGVLIWHNRHRLSQLTALHLCVISALLFIGMHNSMLAVPALAIAGSVLLIRFGESTAAAAIRFTNEQDVSYGVYLYAFPLSQLLYTYMPGQGAFLNFFLTTIMSVMAGYLSWKAVEKPFLKSKRKFVIAGQRTTAQ